MGLEEGRENESSRLLIPMVPGGKKEHGEKRQRKRKSDGSRKGK